MDDPSKPPALPFAPRPVVADSHRVRVAGANASAPATAAPPAPAAAAGSRLAPSPRSWDRPDHYRRLQLCLEGARTCSTSSDLDQAIAMYHEALRLLPDVNAEQERVVIYAGLSRAYQARGADERAALYAYWALQIYEATRDWTNIRRINIRLAELAIARHALRDAEIYLERACQLLPASGPPAEWSSIEQAYALLELERGQIARAADYAQQGLHYAEQARLGFTDDGAEAARRAVVDLHMQAYCVAALVAERQDARGAADALFDAALALQPEGRDEATFRQVAWTYAEILVTRGAYEEAVIQYRLALAHSVRSVNGPD